MFRRSYTLEKMATFHPKILLPQIMTQKSNFWFVARFYAYLLCECGDFHDFDFLPFSGPEKLQFMHFFSNFGRFPQLSGLKKGQKMKITKIPTLK